MVFINYFSSATMPIIILIIVLFGVTEKKQVFDTFLEGAKEGLQIVINIFPTLIGLFLSIGLLRNSGILELIINMLKPVTNIFMIPSEIMPLAMLRPISGSASIAVATDIMKNYGVDSKIGIIASTIMGSTETTLYTIAIYTGSVGIKNIKYILWIALCADFVGIIASIIAWNILTF